MDHQIILHLEVIAQLKSWDDRFLVKKTFYRDIFEEWKAKPLPNDRAQKRMEGFINTHHFSNVKVCSLTIHALIFLSETTFRRICGPGLTWHSVQGGILPQLKK